MLTSVQPIPNPYQDWGKQRKIWLLLSYGQSKEISCSKISAKCYVPNIINVQAKPPRSKINYRSQTDQNKKILNTIVTFCAPEVSRQSPATTIRQELLEQLLHIREEAIHIWRKNQIRISLCRMSMQVPLRLHLQNRFSQLRIRLIKLI